MGHTQGRHLVNTVNDLYTVAMAAVATITAVPTRQRGRRRIMSEFTPQFDRDSASRNAVV